MGSWTLDKVLKASDDHRMVVSNCQHFGSQSGPFHDIRLCSDDSTKHLRKLVGIIVGYRLQWGCAMAFKRELRGLAMPFPACMSESHDKWSAMCGNVPQALTYIEDDTILYRLHDENLTPKKRCGMAKIVRARRLLGRSYNSGPPKSAPHCRNEPQRQSCPTRSARHESRNGYYV